MADIGFRLDPIPVDMKIDVEQGRATTEHVSCFCFVYRYMRKEVCGDLEDPSRRYRIRTCDLLIKSQPLYQLS